MPSKKNSEDFVNKKIDYFLNSIYKNDNPNSL